MFVIGKRNDLSFFANRLIKWLESADKKSIA